MPSIKSCFLILSFVSRAMSFDPHRTPALMTSMLPSSTSPTLSGSCSKSFQPRTCADPRGLRGDGFTASDPLTGNEPNSVVDIFNPIVTEQEGAHSAGNQELFSTEESQIEDQFSLKYNQSLISSTRFYGNHCYASRSGFTTVLAGARSKCGTIESLSLRKRRFDVKIVSKYELFR